MHAKRRVMHEAEKFFERKWDDTMPVERMSVVAAPPTNPSPETSDTVSVRLLTAIEWTHLGGTELADIMSHSSAFHNFTSN